MGDHIQQQYRGQTFDKAIAGYLRGKLLTSGFEPREQTGSGRFWWGIFENSDATKAVACGRVSEFQDYGWGYKIEDVTAWNLSKPNPPLSVRKALVKHGIEIAGVHKPGAADDKFSLMMRKNLSTAMTEAIKNQDESYIIDAIAYLGSSAASVAVDIIEELSSTANRKNPDVSDAVLDAIALNADEYTAKVLLGAVRWNGMNLHAQNAERIFPLLQKSGQEYLIEKFPELTALAVP